MTNREDIFEKYSVPHAMAVMAIPTILSQLITLIYNIADTWFIGQTNNPLMVASCSLVLPAFMLSIVIANIFGVGGGTLVSRLLGVKDPQEAKRVALASWWMALLAALCYCAVCLFLRDPFLQLLGASENTLAYAREYMFFVIILGGTFCVLSNIMSSMIRSIGYSRYASAGLALGGLLNIALDPLFMFVLLPDGKQVMGAAIATMISNMVSFTYFVLIYRKLKDSTVLRLGRPEKWPQKSSFRGIFAVGIPAALSLLLFDLTNIVINRLSAGHGDIELAAIGIVVKVERLPLNTGVGLCLGMMPLVAYNYAAKNYKRMREVFNFTRASGLIFSLLCVVLYRIFAFQIMHAFIKDSRTVAFGTTFLKARCFATPMMFLCFSMVHFMQAIGKGKESFLLAVIRQLVFNIPFLLVLDHLFCMNGIVWTQLIADICTVIVSYLIYFRVVKKEGLYNEAVLRTQL